MRRAKRGTPQDSAWDLLSRAKEIQLATTTAEGRPILRTLNGVVWRDWVLFHGAVAGEKNEGLGQRAVVAAHETLCQVPSHFIGPKMACPATTYYRSVQATGVLAELTDPQDKREMLQLLMEKLQPEGGYHPLTNDGGLYDKDLRSLRVIGVRVEEICGKENLGKDRPPERTRSIVLGLWGRGAPGDLAAIEAILERSPLARPDQLRHGNLELSVFPTRAHAEEHAALVSDQYWRTGVPRERIAASILGSAAWVGAVDPEGTLVGAARAATDHAWVGRICDVIVRPDHRGRGLGRKLLETLLDHPLLREVPNLSLGTRDQQRLYESLGFEPVFLLEAGGSLEMRRRRSRSTSSQSPPT